MTLSELQDIQQQARQAADQIRLPFSSQIWKGQAGEFQGAGVGSSLDFQDHRAYMAGDDPRHINWQAYARTGQYSMKLYREEVQPVLDLVLDLSPSMFAYPEKKRRTLELFYFCVHAARQATASLRIHGLRGALLKPYSFDEIQHPKWLEQVNDFSGQDSNLIPALRKVPLRAQAMRIFISDLLFECSPTEILLPLASRQGRALLFVPFSKEEASPEWEGNYHFVDAESGKEHSHRVNDAILTRYQESYNSHFKLWHEQAQKYQSPFIRIPSEPPFLHALKSHALQRGALHLA